MYYIGLLISYVSSTLLKHGCESNFTKPYFFRSTCLPWPCSSLRHWRTRGLCPCLPGWGSTLPWHRQSLACQTMTTYLQNTNQFFRQKVILISCDVKLIRKSAQSILRRICGATPFSFQPFAEKKLKSNGFRKRGGPFYPWIKICWTLWKEVLGKEFQVTRNYLTTFQSTLIQVWADESSKSPRPSANFTSGVWAATWIPAANTIWTPSRWLCTHRWWVRAPRTCATCKRTPDPLPHISRGRSLLSGRAWLAGMATIQQSSK